MRRWFVPPHFDDEYNRFAAGALHYTLLLILGLAAVSLLLLETWTQRLFIPIVWLLMVPCYVLLRRKRLHAAALLFTSNIWMLAVFASVSINGIRNGSFPSLALVIIYAAILLPERAMIIYTGLSIGAAFVLYIGEKQGVLPLTTTPLYSEDRLLQFTVLFGATGILLAAAARTLRKTFGRLREHEASLQIYNERLTREIAERQEALLKLAGSEATYRLLFDNTAVLSAIYNTEGYILLVNRQAARFFGHIPEEMVGKKLAEFLPPSYAAVAWAQQQRVMETGQADTLQGYITFPDGRAMYYLRHLIPLPPDTPGAPITRVLDITTDLTDVKERENAERELLLS